MLLRGQAGETPGQRHQRPARHEPWH